MALYITVENVVNAASTKEGINLIIDFIKNKKDYDPTFEKIEEGYLIQTKVKGMPGAFSNTVGVYNNCKKKNIIINPSFDSDGNNYITELRDYIQELPIILRRGKINSILL